MEQEATEQICSSFEREERRIYELLQQEEPSEEYLTSIVEASPVDLSAESGNFKEPDV